MAEHKLSRRRKALIWTAVGTPDLLAFMASTSAKEAASNLASCIELFGVPVPDFIKLPGIDEQVTEGALLFYGMLVTLAGLGILKRCDQSQSRAIKT